MELNSIEDVKALTEYQKIEQIQRIEKKIKMLGFDAITPCMLLAYGIWAMWTDTSTSTPIIIVVFAVMIFSVSRSSVERTKLLRELFDLKYGK
ncbi:hypothetical protein [Colwellia sp. TT2012]|uniref:hypothetical protein n=1 Tax=Colwellia sp. TT2012 TaxID=1720342 RepID=UPI00070B90A2|nr:hypothetical protein [Colwellia sp. TT2012]